MFDAAPRPAPKLSFQGMAGRYADECAPCWAGYRWPVCPGRPVPCAMTPAQRRLLVWRLNDQPKALHELLFGSLGESLQDSSLD